MAQVPTGRSIMSGTSKALETYITGLRNQHAVETQAIGTIQNELARTRDYPELHALMEQDKARSEEQAARLDRILARHDTGKSAVKEAVTGAVATVAGFAHAPSADDVLKNVLSAIGFKAYEIASYKLLVAFAERAGASADVAELEQSLREEQEMGDSLGSHLPVLADAFLARQAA
jgi:ferritin-like metal-binding protein YciE